VKTNAPRKRGIFYARSASQEWFLAQFAEQQPLRASEYLDTAILNGGLIPH
jgi:hypothetical protein